jgi:DNA-binding NarL/FixJ family response regulator
VRVVIADDSTLVREGIATLLGRAGVEVVAQAASGEELRAEVEAHEPDVAIVDIRMPPTFTDEGLRAAHEIRTRYPRMGIVILSQHVETGTATRLLAETPQRLGYLLKDRVGDVDEFADALRRVAAGGSVLDAEVVARLLASTRDGGRLASLSAREHEVLALIAEGRSNRAIGERLRLSQRGVQKHVTALFAKLGLTADEDDNRRILAVLEYLRLARPQTAAGALNRR